MLKNVDLSREVAKAEYKRLKGDLDLKLADLQRQVKALGHPCHYRIRRLECVWQRYIDQPVNSAA